MISTALQQICCHCHISLHQTSSNLLPWDLLSSWRLSISTLPVKGEESLDPSTRRKRETDLPTSCATLPADRLTSCPPWYRMHSIEPRQLNTGLVTTRNQRSERSLEAETWLQPNQLLPARHLSTSVWSDSAESHALYKSAHGRLTSTGVHTVRVGDQSFVYISRTHSLCFIKLTTVLHLGTTLTLVSTSMLTQSIKHGLRLGVVA